MVGGVQRDRRRRTGRDAGRSFWPKLRLLIGAAVPVATYLILRRVLSSDAMALAVTSAVPIAWMLVTGLSERRFDPIALVAAGVLGVALVVSLASGGSTLPLKLRRAVVSGTAGIACLASVLVRRPLLSSLGDLLTELWPRSERLTRALGGPLARQKALIATAIIGVTALVDAAAQAALALSVSTTTFVAVSGLTRLAVLAVGLGVCGLYLRRLSSGGGPGVFEATTPEESGEHPPAHSFIRRQS